MTFDLAVELALLHKELDIQTIMHQMVLVL